MRPKSNLIGPSIAKMRYQRGWTQDDLVAKMQLLGCYMTRDILANLETRRSVATDQQVQFFAEVFEVQLQDLFPASCVTPKERLGRRIIGIAAPIVGRCRRDVDKRDE